MTTLRVIRAATFCTVVAAALFVAQTALWTLLFRPWADPLGFGLLFTLATLPLSGTAALFGGLWAARRAYQAKLAASNPN